MSIEASILELAAAIHYLGSRMGEGPAPVAAPTPSPATTVEAQLEPPKKARKPKPEPTPEPEIEIENISEPAELEPEQAVEDPEAAVKALLQSLGM